MLKRLPSVSSRYLVKLVTFSIIPMLLIFWYGNNAANVWQQNWYVCVQIIPDHKGKKVTKIGARQPCK